MIKKGDKVQMVNCMEADAHKDKIWTVRTDSFIPKNYPNELVVMLDGFAGWFACEYLIKIN